MKLDAAKRKELVQAYAREAVAMLQQAIDLGFRDLEQIEIDRGQALQAVATRPDFQNVVASIRGGRL